MDKQKKLDDIAKQVAHCTRCVLYKKAKKSVPGAGNPEAKIVFIGEGPGFNEDRYGIPFCGAAGRVLDQLLQLIKLSRKDVWIGNVVKHRPPENRDPRPEEIEACQPFLDEQIRVIDPEIIVTLGRFSMHRFLPGEYISKIHGQARWITFAGKKRLLIPMYHPAAALRSGQVMQQIREDFQKIPMFLNGQAGEIELTRETKEEKSEQQLSLIR